MVGPFLLPSTMDQELKAILSRIVEAPDRAGAGEPRRAPTSPRPKPMFRAALRKREGEWSVTHGARSGRVAWQFIPEVSGQLGKKLE